MVVVSRAPTVDALQNCAATKAGNHGPASLLSCIYDGTASRCPELKSPGEAPQYPWLSSLERNPHSRVGVEFQFIPLAGNISARTSTQPHSPSDSNGYAIS